MPLPVPNLDDRDFDALVAEARRIVQETCPAWTDFSPSDPGATLLELFAHLTEILIYRLNRVPEKAYITFLNLMGVQLHPPAAAAVRLRFTHAGPLDRPLTIPRGTRVTLERSSGEKAPPIFTVSRPVTLHPTSGDAAAVAETLAHHCDLIEGELAGVGTGAAGLVIQARHPPLIAPTGDDFDLIVAVETDPEDLEEDAAAIQYQGKTYRIWREVSHFLSASGADPIYRVDRVSGKIFFPPAARMTQPNGELAPHPRALGAIPPAGKEIRLWYRRGGGPGGNVAAHTLTVLKDPIPGVSVTNPEPASGGRAVESLENALLRGPQEIHTLERVITARDFEAVALRSSPAVARAKAFNRSELWAYAPPGSVEVVLAPYLPEDQRGPGQVTLEALQTRQTEAVRARIQQILNERSPLGIRCSVRWAHLKQVTVSARVVIRNQENPRRLRERVLARLHGMINPLPTPYQAQGWPFGQALRASHVYEAALAEPGVLWVDDVKLTVPDAPDTRVRALRADPFQPRTWYAASGARLFRTLNHGDGWELMRIFAGETIQQVALHPQRPGWLAVVTEPKAREGSRVHISTDCGETWAITPVTTAFEINDVAWSLRGDAAILLLATDVGLFELSRETGDTPAPLLVDPQDPDLGFYAITASRSVQGRVYVAVAARNTRGIFLSAQGGRGHTFRHIGLDGEDIRVLRIAYEGPRAFLWAGVAAIGTEDVGKGAYRWELIGDQAPPEGWQAFSAGWQGGSCHDLACIQDQVWAASHRQGVLRLDLAQRAPQWRPADVRSGLPLRDPGRFQPIYAVAASTDGRVMAGSDEGVFRSDDGGKHYRLVSQKVFADKVTLPPTWLFCSGNHEIHVVSEDEAQ